MLNAWDPLGLVAFPDDEYDSIRDNLISQLDRGEDRAVVRVFLVEVAEDPAARAGAETVADSVFVWWDERRDTP